MQAKSEAKQQRSAAGDSQPKATSERAGARVVWEVLCEEAVDVIFGYPGGAIMPTYDALPEYPIHHVLVRHEQSAAHMADGYARATGKVGVVLATSGPGATNLVTGITNAMLDSVGIVCITGQVASNLLGSDAFQETDLSGVTLPVTKYNFLATRAEEVAPMLRKAFQLARSGRRGPVLVEITKDAQMGITDYAAPDMSPVVDTQLPPPPSAEATDAILEMLEEAERPLILAGHGIIAAEASVSLREFVDKTGVPVASTLLGLGGLPASHPRALGMLGMHGEAWTNQAVQHADLILAFGMRFDDRVTGKLSTFARRARKVHVDIDAAELNKNVKVELPLQADIGVALEQLNARIAASKGRFTPWRLNAWHEEIEANRRAAQDHSTASEPTDGQLRARDVLRALWEVTAGDATLVTDVGQHQMWAAQCYRLEQPRKLITSGGLGTMGFGLPAGIGARMGRPKGEVWIVAGDGGFQMTAPEMTTAVQEGLDINIAVINNGYLGMVRQWQEMFFEKRYISTPISAPDFVLLAQAHGLKAFRVTSRDEIKPAMEAARAEPGPTLVEFRVEQEDAVYPMVPPGKSIEEMIRRPKDAEGGDDSERSSQNRGER
ncbi:MAG: biosynthetic-type acetolactate synthase large subunit [Deltaproteobacteria bacterium]|nr:biosynthetic-type acetolactate synthase large subunit [Deltaproteobacteria bacterium]